MNDTASKRLAEALGYKLQAIKQGTGRLIPERIVKERSFGYAPSAGQSSLVTEFLI